MQHDGDAAVTGRDSGASAAGSEEGRAPRPAARAPSPLASALRAATHDAHRRLDRSPPLAALMRPGVDADDLRRALARLQPVLAAAEARVADDRAGGWAPRERAGAALADLRALGAAPRPLAATLPQAAPTPAERLGLLYVLEGAMLGSALIARHLAARLPTAPRAHFGDGDRAAAAMRWAAFWDWADAQTLPPESLAEAVRAAQSLFAAFEAQMGEDG